jgi:hypothetical protein
MSSATDLYELLRKGQINSIISNVIVPFPVTDSELPVAFVCGVVDLKSSLRKNGQAVILDEEILKLQEVHSKMGEVIDLARAAAQLKIETDGFDEKEIKEEWSEKDEESFKTRGQRVGKSSDQLASNITTKSSYKAIPSDIEAILRAAEQAETTREPLISKVAQMKKESIPEMKPGLSKLPKVTSASSPILGEIVERTHETLLVADSSTIAEDEVSKRILTNEVKSVAEKKLSKFKQSSLQ